MAEFNIDGKIFRTGDVVEYILRKIGDKETKDQAIVSDWESFNKLYPNSQMKGYVPVRNNINSDSTWQINGKELTLVLQKDEKRDIPSADGTEVNFLGMTGTIDYELLENKYVPDFCQYAPVYEHFLPVNFNGNIMLVPKHLVQYIKQDKGPFGFIQL